MARTLAILSLVLTSLFVIVVLALHILRPNVNPLVQGISYYGIGKFGWLFGLAASLMGLSGRIYNLSGMNFLLIVPTLFLLELQPTQDKAAARPRPTTYWLAWLLLLAAISLFVFNGLLYSLHMGGVFQHLYWLVLVLWLLLKAAFIRSIERAPGS